LQSQPALAVSPGLKRSARPRCPVMGWTCESSRFFQAERAACGMLREVRFVRATCKASPRLQCHPARKGLQDPDVLSWAGVAKAGAFFKLSGPRVACCGELVLTSGLQSQPTLAVSPARTGLQDPDAPSWAGVGKAGACFKLSGPRVACCGKLVSTSGLQSRPTLAVSPAALSGSARPRCHRHSVVWGV